MKIKKGIEKSAPSREMWSTPNRQYVETAQRSGECLLPSYSHSMHAEPDPDEMTRHRCIAAFHNSPYLDAYKILRTRIRSLMQSRGWKTLMVTSAMPGEGKTLTAVNLALTCAKAFDQTVLLVDCDFRRQDIHKYLGVGSERGLLDYLTRDTPLGDLILWPGIDRMTFISGGATVQESTEIMGSSRMHALVEEVKGRYPDRLVIFDTPPVLVGADAIVFAQIVDSIVMVIEHGKTPMRAVCKAIELIPRDKFLGFVLNRDNDSGSTYTYPGA